jgi:hypothetical protein
MYWVVRVLEGRWYRCFAEKDVPTMRVKSLVSLQPLAVGFDDLFNNSSLNGIHVQRLDVDEE